MNYVLLLLFGVCPTINEWCTIDIECFRFPLRSIQYTKNSLESLVDEIQQTAGRARS